jgi:hypothetical protein
MVMNITNLTELEQEFDEIFLKTPYEDTIKAFYRQALTQLIEQTRLEEMEYHRRGLIQLPSKFIDGYNEAVNDQNTKITNVLK